MKKFIYSLALKSFMLLLFCNVPLATNAQLKVLSSGRVDIYNQHVITSNINTDVLDIVNSGTWIGSGYDLIWANYTYNQYIYPYPGLMKLATANTAKFVVKSNGYVGICKTSPTCQLDIVGTGRINGSLILTSDESLKENILPIENASSTLLKLKGVNYNFKYTTEDMDFPGDDFRIEKDSVMVRKNEFGPDFYSRKHLGFLAQDVRQIFPELVFEDSSGILSIDYIGLIPVIVESIKDQDKLLNQQSINITDLESRITDLEKIINIDAKKSSTETIDNINQDDTPFLSQNVPNPFDQHTEIAYYLTESSLNAMINIYNMSGKPIKSIDIANTGQGIITIKGSELQAGMYLYSLIADGVEIDTKRMILTD